MASACLEHDDRCGAQNDMDVFMSMFGRLFPVPKIYPSHEGNVFAE